MNVRVRSCRTRPFVWALLHYRSLLCLLVLLPSFLQSSSRSIYLARFYGKSSPSPTCRLPAESHYIKASVLPWAVKRRKKLLSSCRYFPEQSTSAEPVALGTRRCNNHCPPPHLICPRPFLKGSQDVNITSIRQHITKIPKPHHEHLTK